MTILHYLFQPRCVVCNKAAASNSHWCFSCLRELLQAAKKSRSGALLEYKGKATKFLLRELRSEQHSFALRILGKAIARHGMRANFDFIIAAPQRKNTTGLASFAKKLAELIGAEFLPDIFGKHPRHSQHARSAVERLDGELFIYFRKSAKLLRGKRILVIDDVSTTGTTLLQCKSLLRRAEVAQIEHLVLARRAAEIEGEREEAS